MKKVLIITYYWPPMGGGGVQRWLKTTKYLREYGWEPIIFTTENGEASVEDQTIAKQIPPNIEIHRVQIWEPFAIYKKILGKKKDEKLSPGMGQETGGSSFLHKLSVWVRGNLFIPDARMFWIRPSTKYLRQYLKENKVDAIVSTGPPHTTHMIAYKTVGRYNIPWLADFRDPWTNIDFYHKLMLTKWADKKHKKLEKNVLKKANSVVTVTWSWALDFKEIVDREIKVITNGFDPEDFEVNQKLNLDDKFTILHTGSLNEDRNPSILWTALKALKNEIEGFDEKLEVKFIGQVDHVAIKEMEEHGLERNFNNISKLPHNEVVLSQITAQVLLLPLNDVPNINGVVPGKLYEYLGAQRPIICIGKTTGDAAKIINETNSGVVIDFNDVHKLKEELKQSYFKYLNNDLQVNSSGYEKYSRKHLAKLIAQELSEISA